MNFVAYLHCTPNGVPFYVGKGTPKRAKNLVRNARHATVVAKYRAKNILVGTLECSKQDIAFELERGLIKCLRRQGVDLCNLTSGGEGTFGWNHTAENKAKISATQKGRPKPQGVKDAVAKANAKRVWKPESLEKLSVAAKGRTLTDEHVAKVAASNRGKKRSEETKAKIGAAMKIANTGRKQDPEWIAKRIAARVATVNARKQCKGQ